LRDDDVEMLFHAVDSAEEETHSHDEEQIRQHTADQRGLDDDDFLLDQGNDGDD
jgi:hypothetical protein